MKQEFTLGEIQVAIEQRQFEIYLQPKYEIETDSIAGAECLVRWNHPQKEL